MTITDPIRAALKRLLMTAKLLQQNAEGCAYNHYGRDCELNDLPGWLRDTKADIDAAQQALATPPAPSAQDTWNKALEAAAKVAGAYDSCCADEPYQKGFIEGAKKVAQLIHSLHRGAKESDPGTQETVTR
jgi:hypothetical protein